MGLPGKSGRPLTPRVARKDGFGLPNSLTPRCQEKPRFGMLWLTVPQTDTGRRGENPKVLEITLVKELGKMAP